VPTTCFVSYELHPTTIGGAGVLIHHAAEALLRADHEVVFLLDVPADAFARLLSEHVGRFPHPERVRAYRVEELCAEIPLRQGAFECVFQWKSYQFAWAIARLLERERVDFVELFEYCGAGYYALVNRLYAPEAGGPGPVLGARLHGSLEVLDRDGQGAVRDRDRYLMHGLERRGLALAEAVLAPSRTYYERYYREHYGIEPERVVVSSPPKQAFPRVTRRPSVSGGDGAFSIAFIGRMFHLKGVDQLVNACVMLMKQRPGLQFTVDLIGYDSVGQSVPGSYTAYLRTLIPAGLRGRFNFLGQLPHAEIAERLNDALFAVFPNRVESFCYALHEVYDAGVPVVINDLPAFGDFFTHGKNALVYDGTTRGLVEAMARLIDDGVLREGLCRPYAVAEEGIGGFYDSPRALRPLGTRRCEVEPLVVVLGDGSARGAWPVLPALRAQTAQPGRVLCFSPAEADAVGAVGVVRWLGRAWTITDAAGEAVDPSDAVTASALAVLQAGDEPAPEWLERCVRALSRSGAAFAGTWLSSGGAVRPLTTDTAPELHPFEHGESVARVLVRTEPGVLLGELLDSSLGALGHTGLVWSAVGRHGHGTLLPEALLQVQEQAAPANPAELQALIMRFGEPFGERLAHLAGLMHARAAAAPQAHPPTTHQKIQMADELGGSLLAKMAIKKLAKRARPNARKS